VLQLNSFDSGYSLFVLGTDFWSWEKGSDIIKKKIPPNIAFHFFYYHKINLHLDISIFEQLFFLCFLKYESFSNCHQSHYRSIGYFEGIYAKCVTVLAFLPNISTVFFSGKRYFNDIFMGTSI
jgi:hypothetical protein